MAAESADVLKEYLVGLGFKIDANSYSKLSSALGKTEKMVIGFAGAIAGMALGTAAYVDKVAGKMDDLYWSSVRLRDGAANIEDFKLSISKMGGSADGAAASMENLARYLQTNPASEPYLNHFGIATRKINGDLRSAADIIKDIAKLPQPLWLKTQIAAKAGVDYQTLMATIRGDTAKSEAVVSHMWKMFGISADDAAKKSHDFENRLADQKAELSVLADVVGYKLLPFANKMLGWLQDVTLWASKATGPAGDLTRILERLAPVGEDLAGTTVGLANLIGTVGGKTLDLISGMPPEALEFGMIGYFLFGKKPAFLLAMLGLVSAGLDKLSGDKKQVAEDKVQEYGTSDKLSVNRWLFDNGLGYLNTNTFNTTYAEFKNRQRKGGASPAPGSPDFRAIEKGVSAWTAYGSRSQGPGGQSAPGGAPVAGPATGGALAPAVGKALAFFQNAGWTAAQAAAIVANLLHENSTLNPKAVGDSGLAVGIAQWHPDRQQDFKKWSGGVEVGKASVDQQLAFLQYEMTQGSRASRAFLSAMAAGADNARLAAIAVSKYVEAPKDPTMAKANARADTAEKLLSSSKLAPPVQVNGNVTVNQKTEIKVSSNGDPAATGRAVGREQSRVNGDMVRNFAGATR